VIGNVGRVLWILLGTVGIVLAIACVNVANLFMVRAEARRQELSIRAALGASHGRVARALLSETLMLGLAGGAVGLLFAQAGIALLRRLAPATLPRVDEIGIDLLVVLLTIVISLLTGLLFGLMPVLRFGKPSVAALKEGGRAGSSGPARQRTRNTLVIAEVAMAFVLLITSGLMVRTFMALRDVQPGFVRPEEVQTFRISVPPSIAADGPRLALTHQQIAERLRQVPGVVSVGLSSHVTMDGEDNTNAVYVEHVDALDAELPPLRRYKSVAPGYFETMGNRLVAGRAVDWTDIQQIRPVAVVSEALARQYWPRASDALGKRIKGYGPTWFEIVGVSGDERDDGLSRPATPIVYWPLLNENYTQREMAYVVRSSRVGTPGFLGELRRAVWSQNSSLPLADVRTLVEIQGDSMAQTSFIMVMLALAASVALLLSVVGIYGVITCVATQRTREMGIRLALGAQARDVRRLVLNHGVVLCGVGIALGVGVSLGLDRVMSALLFGVRATDLMTYVVISVGLAAIALLATWIPAHRVSRVDPIAALRADI
jgi:predicted permease